VPVNLSDCPPFASMPPHCAHATDLQEWRELYARAAGKDGQQDRCEELRRALALGDGHADLRYRLGLCGGDEAPLHFSAARDLDALRFRADRRVNAIIRSTAAHPGIVLVDMDSVLHGAAPRAPDRDLFLDHVHFSERGNYEVASAMLPPLLEMLNMTPNGATNAPALDDCCAALGLNAWNRMRIRAAMLSMMSRPPFTAQLDHARRLYAQRREILQIAADLTPGSLREETDGVLSLLEKRPDDDLLRWTTGNLLGAANRWREAAAQFEILIARFPGHPELLAALGRCRLAQDRREEAESLFDRAVERTANRLEMQLSIAATLVAAGHLESGTERLYRALDIDPEAPSVHSLLGDVLIQQQRPAEAVTHFEQALHRAPYDSETRMKLGVALLMLGNASAARTVLTETVQDDPYSAAAYLNLARACISLQRADEAVHAAERARELASRDDPHFLAVCAEACRLAGRTNDAKGESSKLSVQSSK